MASLIKVLTLCTLILGYFGALTGNQKISTHHYDAVAGALDMNPVFCGVLGKDMDIDRITAVQGLTNSQCGTCLKITNGSKSVYVMALDMGGKGLDLNKASFVELYGEDTGIFDAQWEPTDPSNCVGIVRSGDYSLPGMKNMPITKPVEKVAEPTQLGNPVHLTKSTTVPDIPKEDKSKEQAKSTNQKELTKADESIKTIPTLCPISGQFKCANKAQISVCSYGVLFPITCAADTECQESNGIASCVFTKFSS